MLELVYKEGVTYMYRIGEFSKMAKITVKALRYYDEINLLKPEYVDKFTNYRFYTTDQLFKLHYIQSLRQVGLSIPEIKLIINGKDATRILSMRQKELESEIANSHEQLSRIEFILSGQEEEFLMNYQATIKQLPECIVYSKKMTVPSYNSYFEVIPQIGKVVTEKYPDIKCTIPEYCFIVYLDGEYREKDISIEFCEAIDKMKPDFDDIVFKKIESVEAVSVMHKGPYDTLQNAYSYAFKWIEENGYIHTNFPRESYIDGIWNKDNVEDWLTELQIPIAKKI